MLATKRGIKRRVEPQGYAAGYRRALGMSKNSRYSEDPNGWTVDPNVLGEFLWSKQREIGDSVVNHRYTAVQSAHDTGKSFRVSRLAAWWIDTKPDPFVVTTAPTWKQVNAILWREIRKAHRKGELPGRINLDAEWYLGSDELVAFGRKPADYDQAAFQGIHAMNVLVIIDEADGVPQGIFEAADSLATNKRARVVAIGNPDDPTSHFAKVCKPASGWNVLKISAFDTPAFTDEEVPEYLYDLLVSPEWVDERKKRWGIKSPIYTSKVLGEFPDISDDALLTPRMIKAAQDRSVMPRKNDKGRLGCDVARFGDDETAVYRARAGRVRYVDHWSMMDTMETADKLASLLRPFNGALPCNIDTVGLGAGVYDRLNQLNFPVSEFIGSEAPYDNVRFHNRRAEAYWYMRDLADSGELDLPPDGEDDDLIAELGAIKWKLMPGGRIAIESKEDMRKRLNRPSPDRADAAAMALWSGGDFSMPDLRHLKKQSHSETADLLSRPL